MKSIDEDRFEPFIEKSVSMKLNEMQKARKEWFIESKIMQVYVNYYKWM